jgi:hypothetical protein
MQYARERAARPLGNECWVRVGRRTLGRFGRRQRRAAAASMHETARVEVVQRVAAANREIGHRRGGSTISRVGIRRWNPSQIKRSSEGTTTKGRQARELTPRSRYRSRRERQGEVYRHIRARTASKPRVQTSTCTPPPVGTRPDIVKKAPKCPRNNTNTMWAWAPGCWSS